MKPDQVAARMSMSTTPVIANAVVPGLTKKAQAPTHRQNPPEKKQKLADVEPAKAS